MILWMLLLIGTGLLATGYVLVPPGGSASSLDKRGEAVVVSRT